eukprot:CAMPEP_0198726086 /NCGR_PEP_ID=MMETSP1475-20131203/3253_1 /TAXON_ID= ORGANISM="Unidentified sp., Strain CCMP1999" /NCGR_SAMPLE_ID=MMETSP1475 /ASSEMBLY_ACC=CAM_ASM_001111 /LENGTH=43 /DNA_ID= /DNA_START= /DNA_END= /DNA_ORIENTATION=
MAARNVFCLQAQTSSTANVASSSAYKAANEGNVPHSDAVAVHQ